MASTQVLQGGAEVKVRRPWGVAALSLVPFYWCVWYYRVNREMRDFGRTRADAGLAGSKPGRSALAVTLGALVWVPALVSRWRAVRRMQVCEEIGTAARGADGLFVMVIASSALGVIPAFVTAGGVFFATVAVSTALTLAATFVMQRRLNAVWRDSAQ